MCRAEKSLEIVVKEKTRTTVSRTKAFFRVGRDAQVAYVKRESRRHRDGKRLSFDLEMPRQPPADFP